MNDVSGRQKPKLSQINVYTDGSKTSQGTGAGFVELKGKNILIHTASINLDKTATIFQVKAAAIQKAAEYLTQNPRPSQKYIKIFSDSQAVRKALEKNDLYSHTILNVRHTLNTLRENTIALSLIWIKAHHGFEGNEVTDEYAKKATIDTTNYMITQTTKQEIRNIIETKSNEYCCRKWERYKYNNGICPLFSTQ